MELTQNIIQRLNQLLAKPALVGVEDMLLLNAFSERYPYFQPIYLLMAKTAANDENQARLLTKASIYNNGILLHRFIHQPQSLKPAEDFNVLAYKTSTKKTDFVSPEDDYKEKEIATSKEALETIPETQSKAATCLHSQETAIANEISLTEKLIKDDLNETDYAEQTIGKETEREVNQENQNKEIDPLTEETYHQSSFSEANFFEQELAKQNAEPQVEEQHKANNEDAELEIQAIRPEKAASAAIADEPLEEPLALSDFFAFENSIADTNREIKPDLEEEYASSHSENSNIISKYDDDELPYTFLWWLQKTRSEHAQIFRPYAPVAKPQPSSRPKTISEQLQHQYVEHIFYLQTPFIEEAFKNHETKTPPISRKNDEIIEKFIQNNPHIQTLNPDQIDNENKAKKSAEDRYELVSETLAEIYVEQMLFHKAIDTYRKLSLKFPEKNRYFADLIQSLEKKI